MKRTFLLWFLASGCGGTELLVIPETLHFGTVNFAEEEPPGGYAATQLIFDNAGRKDLAVVLEDVDPERFAVSGLLAVVDPPTVDVPGEASAVITVGVVGYVPGEWDTLVEGAFTARGGDAAVAIPWSYTPTRVEAEE